MPANAPTQPEHQLRVVPALVGSLMLGLVLFAAAAVVIGRAETPSAPGAAPPAQMDPAVLLGVLAALLAGCLVAFFAFGAAARSQARSAWQDRGDDESGRARLAGILSTSTILRAALAEGPGLFACVIILLTGDLISLAAVAVAVGLMATLLPVRSRLARLEEAAAGPGRA